MKRCLLALLLACCGIALNAQAEYELIELDTLNLSLQAWQAQLDALRELEQPLGLDSRLRISQNSAWWENIALYQLRSEALLLRYRHDLKTGTGHFLFNTSLRNANLEAMLGIWRFRFGRGIALGNGSRAAPDSLFSLQLPSSALNYAPTGTAMTLTFRNLRGGLFASFQNREARLQEGLIRSLPKTRTGLLGTTRENWLGGALGWQNKHAGLALLACYQSYDREFVQPKLDSRLLFGSFYGWLRQGAHLLDAELCLAGAYLSSLATWQYSKGGFRQTVSHALAGIQHQLPYSTSPAALVQSDRRRELSYELRAPLPLKGASAQLRYSLNHGPSFSAGQLSRLIAAFEYSRRGNLLRASYQGFDREIIALADSGYSAREPRNHRLAVAGRYWFLPLAYQQVEFSYHLEDKRDYSQNSYRASSTWGWKLPKLTLKAGFVTWQSPRSFLAYDELEPQNYSLCANDDTQVFASASGRIKDCRLSCTGRLSLLHPQKYSLLANLGLSLF